eukprot:scaffold34202_cov69-Phaeocystis_antarctica.AAC.1
MALRCAPIHAYRPTACVAVGRPSTIQAQKNGAALRSDSRVSTDGMRCRRWPLSAHTSMHEAARESRTTAFMARPS